METAVQMEAPRTSRWEDFIDVFISPAELLRRRANDSWTVPILVLSALILVLYYAFMPVMMPLWQAAATMNATPEQAAAMQQNAGAMRMFTIIGGLFAPIINAIYLAILAGIAWAGGRVVSASLGYKQALNTVTWSAFITIPQQLAIAISVMLATRSGEALHPIKHTNIGPLRFMDVQSMNEALVPLFARIDVFAIWQMVVVAIGVRAITGVSQGASFFIAALVWIAYALPQVIGAAF